MIKLKTLAENPNVIKGDYKYIDVFIGDFFIISSVPKENLYIELKAKIIED